MSLTMRWGRVPFAVIGSHKLHDLTWDEGVNFAVAFLGRTAHRRGGVANGLSFLGAYLR